MSALELKRRVLGVDYGKARIGVAVSDELGLLAHPLETIPAARLDVAAKRVAELARSHDVAAIVLGIPRQMNGAFGSAADEVKVFADKLRGLIVCPLITWDERLTTVAAQRALRDAGRKTRHSRHVVDQVAAQMILQGYLDSRAAAADEAPPSACNG